MIIGQGNVLRFHRGYYILIIAPVFLSKINKEEHMKQKKTFDMKDLDEKFWKK